MVANYLYDFVHLTSGLLWPPPTDFIAHTERYYVGQLVVLIFFYTSLYTVKLSFLLFFKRLGHNVYRQKYIWWPVLIFTLATYFVCIGDIQYKCIIRPFTEIAASCSTAENVQFTLVTLKFNCAMDVLTDFLSTSFLSSEGYMEETQLLIMASHDYTIHPSMERTDALGKEVGIPWDLFSCDYHHGIRYSPGHYDKLFNWTA